MRPQTVSTEEILKVAREVFLERGTSVSVQVIADRVGISQPALFKRFGNKEKLLQSAFKNSPTPEWLKMVEAGVTDEPIEDQLFRITRALVDFFEMLHPIIRMMKSSGISHFDMLKTGKEPVPNKSIRLLSNWFEECNSKGLIPKTDYRMAASALIGIIHIEVFSSFLKNKNSSKLDIDDTYIKNSVSFVLRSVMGGKK